MLISGFRQVKQRWIREDEMVVPPRKEPEIEKKQKLDHEPQSKLGEEKESKERKQKALKEIEMGMRLQGPLKQLSRITHNHRN